MIFGKKTQKLERKVLVLEEYDLIEAELTRGGLEKSHMVLAKDYQEASTCVTQLAKRYNFIAAVIEPTITPSTEDYKKNVPMTPEELAKADLEKYNEYQNLIELLKKHNPDIEICCVCAIGPAMNDPIYRNVRVVPMHFWGHKETNPICQVGNDLKMKYF